MIFFKANWGMSFLTIQFFILSAICLLDYKSLNHPEIILITGWGLIGCLSHLRRKHRERISEDKLIVITDKFYEYLSRFIFGLFLIVIGLATATINGLI